MIDDAVLPISTKFRQKMDVQLLSRLKNGDENAFKRLFSQWRKPLLKYVKSLTGLEQDAEDICQETFATLWEKRDTIDTSKNISTFIFLIAQQKTWKLIRELKRIGEFRSDPTEEKGDTISPEDRILFKELELHVEYAIGTLPPRMREIYRMHYEEGLSHAQISERLGINSTNVAMQLCKARKRIGSIILLMAILLTSHYLTDEPVNAETVRRDATVTFRQIFNRLKK